MLGVAEDRVAAGSLSDLRLKPLTSSVAISAEDIHRGSLASAVSESLSHQRGKNKRVFSESPGVLK